MKARLKMEIAAAEMLYSGMKATKRVGDVLYNSKAVGITMKLLQI